jgi:hypothetical protein
LRQKHATSIARPNTLQHHQYAVLQVSDQINGSML